jgi:hypothetical protein
MRWTDLPPERGPADGGGSALSRGEWQELRRRLERLPPGHPSHPDGEGAERADEDGWPPGQPGPDPDAGQPGGGDAGRERPGGGDAGREQAGRAAGRGRPGGHGELAGPGNREPYRPWFTAGESPEPWFTAGPD